MSDQIVTSTVLGFSFLVGCKDNRTVVSSLNDDLIEVSWGNVFKVHDVTISKTKFAQFMASEISQVQSVFNVRVVEGTFSDDIAFSAILDDGKAYHNIQCGVDFDYRSDKVVGSVAFEDCASVSSDGIRFGNDYIVASAVEINAIDQ
ncbi:MAG: hypothetical protein OXK80_03960 [Bdellovibrionales bacterium]|nr:hypothetical protein [Bdellovibrionales bacterium]